MTNISPAILGRLKSELRAALPQVKSSHASEALAAGLGFSKHASLLSALRDGKGTAGTLDPSLLSARLVNLGYQLSDEELAKVGQMAVGPALASVEPAPRPADVCRLTYGLIADHMRAGIGIPDSLRIIADALSDDGTALEGATRRQALALLARIRKGWSLGQSIKDMVPPLEHVLIEIGEMAGNIVLALDRVIELSQLKATGPQAVRAVMLRCISSLAQSGVQMPHILELLSIHDGDYPAEMNAAIHALAARALDAVRMGHDLGSALREEYPPLEWVLFGPMFRFDGDVDQVLERASARLMAALP